MTAFLIVLTSLNVSYAQTFEQWIDSEETKILLTNESERFAEIATESGLDAAYVQLVQDIQALNSLTENENVRKKTFLVLMDSMANVDSVDILNPLSRSIRADPSLISRKIVNNPVRFSSNMLTLSKSTQESGTYLLKEGEPNEIKIDHLSESEVDRGLWTAGFTLNRMIGDTRLATQEYTRMNILDARNRWSQFMTSVVHDQYIWETLANSALSRWVPKFGGTLTQPPTIQMRLLHPAPVMAYSSIESAQFTPRIALDVLGFRALSGQSGQYQPRYGFSVMTLLPGSQDEDFGWGIAWTRKNFSLGLVSRDQGDENNVLTVTVALKTSGMFVNDSTGIQDFVNNKLDSIIDDVSSTPFVSQ